MTLPHDIDDFLDPILATFEDTLTLNVQGHLVNAYLRGSAQTILWGRTKLKGLPILYEGPPMQQAINYAQKHISKAKLVDGITLETKARLSEIISDGIKNKRGIDGIARDLRMELEWQDSKRLSEIKGLSLKSRSEMIARTETAEALGQASNDRFHDLGVQYKEVVVTEPCDICLANAAEGEKGIVPIDHVYSSGHTWHPFHPRCRCCVVGVIPKS